MIINTYDPSVLEESFGIDMETLDVATDTDVSLGSGWGRVAPGVRSTEHQHDEIEMFVIVAGSGDIDVDGKRHPVAPGTMVVFEPFETHTIENTGAEDLLFITFYWRDLTRAAKSAALNRTRFDQRPVFVFSTPPTPNGDLHLGHLSGPYLGADVFVRYQRMNGVDAWHLTGSDDFQSYVVGAARRDGRDPAATAAHYSREIAETLRLMDIEVDQYTATDKAPEYRAGLRDFFTRLVDSGAVSLAEGRALFGADGEYLYEGDVSGLCPTCGQGTGGNICEDCGEPNTCADLDAPRTADGQTPTEGAVTRFSLPLHEFGPVVRWHHKLGRVPVRLRELAQRVLSRERFDVPVSHPSSWGVEPEQAGADGQRIWVWPEMSYGFLYGIEALGRRLGHDWRGDDPRPDWKIVHFFGYDNSFYHSILYPVLYNLAHPDWQPDIDYHVNEFYLLEGSKFSTSRRHAVWGKEVLEPRSVDAVRFHLALTRPEGRRTNFERADYEATVRGTLIGTWQRWLNDLGERVGRAYDGVVPDAGNWSPEHTAFLARLNTRLAAATTDLGHDGFSLNGAAATLTGIVEDALRFGATEGGLVDLAGFESDARTAVALELAAARLLAQVAAPVMPRFAANLAEALGGVDLTGWPRRVGLVPAGTKPDLAERVFFDPAILAGGAR